MRRLTVTVALATVLMLGGSGCANGSGSVGPGPTAATTTTTAAPRVVVPQVVEPTQPPATVPKPAGLARSVPVRLEIPAIGVDSTLMDLGLQADGTMEVPPEGFPAGWYTGAPTPGEIGPAVIAGHVDWTGPGVFYNLRDLVPDDEILVTRADGSVVVFAVTVLEQFAKDEFPTDRVYGDLDVAGLRLITCGGSFNRATGHYEDNIVAFAELVPPAS